MKGCRGVEEKMEKTRRGNANEGQSGRSKGGRGERGDEDEEVTRDEWPHWFPNQSTEEEEERRSGESSCQSANQDSQVVRVRLPWRCAALHLSVFGWSAWQRLAGAALPLASGNSCKMDAGGEFTEDPRNLSPDPKLSSFRSRLGPNLVQFGNNRHKQTHFLEGN